MALRRVLIENFRSIKRCEFNPSALCALVGENNAGKSNILEAIDLVLGREFVSVNSFTLSDHYGFDPDADIVIELEFDPPLQHQAFKSSPTVDVPVLRYTVTQFKVNTKKGKKGDPRLETSCLKSDGGTIMVQQEAPKKGKPPTFAPLTNIPPEIRDQVPVIFIGTDRSLERQLPAAGRSSLLRRLLDDVNDRLRETSITVHEDGKDVERPAVEVFEKHLAEALKTLRIPEFQQLEALLRNHSLENLGYDPKRDVERLRFHFGLFDSMAFYRAVRLLFTEGGLEMDATRMGKGAQNALVMAIFQAYEELRKQGAIFLIEEPEMFLHPHRRRFFYQTLQRVSAANQVLYTTHSADLVSVPEFENVRLVYRDPELSTVVRASTLEADAPLREKLRQDFDPERNELFFARHVLLVEGDTEKLSLPEYARRLGVNLDRVGCSMVEVGGKRNLPTFVDLVSSFGIPVTVVFDTDSSDFKGKEVEEEAFNATLRDREGDGTRVIELDPKYESVLRKELGDAAYQALTQKFPGLSKARRARLIAADPSMPVPTFAKQILEPFQETEPAIAE